MVNNGAKDNRLVTVHLTVDPVNDALVGRNRSVVMLLEVSDPDDYELIYSTVSNPVLRTVSDSDESRGYSPTPPPVPG